MSPIQILRYPNRKLYIRQSDASRAHGLPASYVNLPVLKNLIENGIDFQVFNSQNAEDITKATLDSIALQDFKKALGTKTKEEVVGLIK